MAYGPVLTDRAVSVNHVVYDAGYTAPQTGHAANITKVLYKPDMTVSGLTVTVTEIGTSGYYLASFTPDEAGVWKLRLTNPAGTDQNVIDYDVSVVSSPQLVTATGRLLTSRARVKERLVNITGTEFDDLFDSLISEVSVRMQDEMGGRTLPEATYTEYHDGHGLSRLWLREGPLVSVTSLNHVSYSDGGSGARSETLTEVYPYQYVLEGTRDEGHRHRGSLKRLGGIFTEGSRNYKVVYTAGYDPLPEGMVNIATDWVIAAFHWREGYGQQGQFGQGTLNLKPDEIAKGIREGVAPYSYGRASL
jgi:hypothetical protein